MRSRLWLTQVVLVCTAFTGAAFTGAASIGAAEPGELPQQFEVQVADSTLQDMPVFAVLKLAGKSPPAIRVREITGGKDELVPAQWDATDSSKIWWLVRGTTPANSKRLYRLEVGEIPQLESVQIDRDEKQITAKLGTRPLLKYNAAHIEPPAGIDPGNGRSAYIHPVWTPSGKIVTEEFPADHAHQSGIFLAHTKSEFEGRELNFWDLLKGRGRVRFKAFDSATSGPVFGEFRVEHEHVDMSVPGGKVAALEMWQVRIWNGGSSPYWMLDVTSTLRCSGPAPLKLLKYHYGGMAIRGSGEWGGSRAHFVTSEGKGRVDGNHTRPIWCDLSGRVGDGDAGVALVTHPQNFRFPEPLRIHPSMPYMVYAPSHLGDWELTPGSQHVSRYRFIVHDGVLPGEALNQLAQRFGEPLVARLSTDP